MVLVERISLCHKVLNRLRRMAPTGARSSFTTVEARHAMFSHEMGI
jgi:hypothetical protein